MSNLLMMVVVIGIVAVGIAKRCEWLGICNTAAAPPPAPAAPAAPAAQDDGKADDSDNGKKQKCGCCNCKQNSVNEIVCDTGAGSATFTGGLSLDAQCNACAKDPNICKNAKAAQKAADAAKQAAKQAANNQKAGNIKCSTGSELRNGVCTPIGKKTQTPNTVVDGCPKGTFRDCELVGAGVKTINCKCSKSKVQYARALYSINNNYHINKFSRIAI